MAEVHRLPDMDQVERQASDWIARLNADDVSDDDWARFEAWRSAHQLNARIYDELEATWRAFTAAGPLVRAVAFGQSMNEVSAVRPSKHRWAIAAVAAAAVIMVVTGLWFSLRFAPETIFQTGIGENAVVALPDASTLQLNTNSSARVEYSARARVIRLERGEAYFQVAHDAQRPFWVVAGDSWIRAVGTAFDVHRRATSIRVTVSEGAVKLGFGEVSTNRAQLDGRLDRIPARVLRAGQQGDVQAKSIEVRSLSADDMSRSVGWRSGMIYFDNEPLHQVIEEISRYTSLQLSVTDAKLRGLRIGGTFQASAAGADAFLSMLEDGFGMRVRRQGNDVYIEAGATDNRHVAESDDNPIRASRARADRDEQP